MRVALCQVAATADPAHNLALVRDGVTTAARAGARLVVLPEATMARFGTRLRDVAEPLDGPWASAVRETAAASGVTVVVGMFTPGSDGDRVRNTLLVTGPGCDTRYDKLHLFDAYGSRESDTVEPGGRTVVVDVDGVRVGLATCYDVRFPALFTALASAGAEVVALPASWGDGPGKAEQWDLLVRARALDATTVVVACDQAEPRAAGLEPVPGAANGIGRSCVVSPLGEVRDRLGAAPGVLLADLDVAEVRAVRARLPVLEHLRAVPAVARTTTDRPG
ncbi:carbon-nitrogen hydrolase family protein [Aquipuribacter sp. SD81]|uniref:carbon-nitrogen hydrolase family protein n=1 Tax=Aquipuribacter sp. SD81 TaxID=3127703 RepID=UPI00301AAC75